MSDIVLELPSVIWSPRSAPAKPAASARSKPSLTDRLAAIDWDFPERTTQSPIEGFHPYPAKFITHIPAALLDHLPVTPGTTVFDPFCGSGTTLVECQRRGLHSVGIDLNPIACLMTRVKTSPVPRGIISQIPAVLGKARATTRAAIPDIPNLDHWFQPQVRQALAGLSLAIGGARPAFQDILRLALSSIIVRVSNQDSDTRYAAIAKTVSRDNVFDAFEKASERILQGLVARAYSHTEALVIEGDTLAVTPEQITKPVSLVITSPPYPNAYEYWLYHKYRMWWLGLDPLAVKEKEIGARAHFFKTNHHTADHFVVQMRQTFALLQRTVITGGYVCFVVGRSKIHGELIDNAAIIEAAGRDYGFARIFRKDRAILANRKSFNLSHANIKTEAVLVLRRTVA